MDNTMEYPKINKKCYKYKSIMAIIDKKLYQLRIGTYLNLKISNNLRLAIKLFIKTLIN
jgi:hypothetical protein